jgi:hypothetical protein
MGQDYAAVLTKDKPIACLVPVCLHHCIPQHLRDTLQTEVRTEPLNSEAVAQGSLMGGKLAFFCCVLLRDRPGFQSRCYHILAV